jgi:integrase
VGKQWRPFEVDGYRLGHLKGQAVAVWRGESGRHRERLGSATTEAEAKALLRAFVAGRKVDAPPKVTTVAYIFERYTADREVDGKDVATFRHNWKALAPFFAPLPPHTITDELCREYARQRLKDGRSVGTVWTELGRLRAAINWAYKRHLIDRPPYVWMPSKPASNGRALTVDEAERLVAAAVMPHVRLFIILGIATGARTGALLQLRWDKVDLESRSIDLRRPAPEDPLSKRARKGRAVVYINDWARAALSEAHVGRLTDYVIEWNGRPVECIRVGFMAACKRAGIGGVSPHDLRHTAATWLADESIDMERIARFLGHSNPQVTRSVYAKPDHASMADMAKVTQLTKRSKVR